MKTDLQDEPTMHRRVFLALWGLGLLGTIAGLPFILMLSSTTERLSVPIRILSILGNAAFMTALFIYFGIRLGKRLGLGAPIVERWVMGMPSAQVRAQIRPLLPVSIGAGVLTALVQGLLEATFFAPRITELAALPEPPLWASALASLYGGITEELTMHLGLFTIEVWFLTKMHLGRFRLTVPAACWLANVLTSLMFGAAHLPMTSSVVALTPLVVGRALLLNGIGGFVFGHLYWTRGLEAAMIAHLATDLAILLVP